MNFTISELHFIKRNIEARLQWIEDNPNDDSIEEGEMRSIESAVNKLNDFQIELATKSKEGGKNE